MKRQLTFDGANDSHRTMFGLLVDAARYGRRQDSAKAPGIETIRKERRIMRALQKVGIADPTNSGDKHAYGLAPGGGDVVLDQADFDLLKGYVENGVPWVADVSCDVADLSDLMSAAAVVDDADAPAIHAVK